ncbi:unnamed protein product [Oikopleura dioica]|uniref:V-SNARE coiled-coil homology domain-containing protein n=1 Tax=Oikopleura dioica TaxID=34765 RepID=E4XP55_OIKDI|nr:unnamed protein product [Oikopleura dioica]
MSDQPLSQGEENQPSYGTNANQAPSSSRKMQATKAQVDEVVDIMRTNVEAVLERDAKISMMDDRADALHQGASQFETQAAKLKNKFWLENMKYMIALGIVALIVIGVAVYNYQDNKEAITGITNQAYFGPVPTQSAGVVPSLVPAEGAVIGQSGGVPQGVPSSMSAPEVLAQPGNQVPQSDLLASGADNTESVVPNASPTL